MRGSVEFASDVTPIELQLIMESSTGDQWKLLSCCTSDESTDKRWTFINFRIQHMTHSATLRLLCDSFVWICTFSEHLMFE
jgi:hypothetical protein